MSGDVIVFDDNIQSIGTVIDQPTDVLVFDAPASPLKVEKLTGENFLLFDSPDPGLTVLETPQDFLLLDAPPSPSYLVGENGEDFLVITSGSRGEQGVPGANGVAGTAGADGVSGGSFVFVQGVPSTVWDVIHTLGYTPNVMVIDTAGTIMEGDVLRLSPTHFTITFSVPVSGSAYLS